MNGYFRSTDGTETTVERTAVWSYRAVTTRGMEVLADVNGSDSGYDMTLDEIAEMENSASRIPVVKD